MRCGPHFTRYGAGLVAAFCVLTVVCGLGFGWIGALGVPSSIRSILSPPTVVGIGLENLLSWLQVPDVLDTTVTAVQRIGTLVGVALAARIAWRLGPVAPVRALAWVVTILVLTGSVVHPWYILWCGIFLGMTEATRFWPRRIMVWVTAGLVIYSTVDAAFRNGALAFGVTAALGLAWVALGHDRDLDREQDRDRIAALGRWATVQGWYAVIGEALSGPPTPARERLDREPIAGRRQCRRQPSHPMARPAPRVIPTTTTRPGQAPGRSPSGPFPVPDAPRWVHSPTGAARTDIPCPKAGSSGRSGSSGRTPRRSHTSNTRFTRVRRTLEGATAPEGARQRVPHREPKAR